MISCCCFKRRRRNRRFTHSLLTGLNTSIARLAKRLAWWLNWQIWGYDPLPFQPSLAASSCRCRDAAWALAGRSLSRNSGLWDGWLARSFAVYPLSAEAVGWLADQWDLWAAVFYASEPLPVHQMLRCSTVGNDEFLYFLSLFSISPHSSARKVCLRFCRSTR